jgi:outer membrane protein assembly factor BamB
MVFVASGYGDTKLYAIRLGGHGDVTDTHIAWKTKSHTPKVPSMLLLEKDLYYVSDKGRMTCVNAIDGTQYWQERIGKSFSASPVFAAGRIYVTTEKGITVVVRAGRKFELLAVNDLAERTLASPAVLADSLFIRTESNLYCIKDTSAKK